MMFDFECYILQKYIDEEYENINVFGNLNDAVDFILKQTAPYDYRIQCLTPGKPCLYITYEMEAQLWIREIQILKNIFYVIL